jgi:NADPH:quinone reductase-like Zn-dependent oxidoreductase
MKAVIYNEYGDSSVLKYSEIDKPRPNEDEVLIKIAATSVTPMDWKFRSGNVLLARLMSGIVKPKNQLLGVEISGRIETIGNDISSFNVGDFVYQNSIRRLPPLQVAR